MRAEQDYNLETEVGLDNVIEYIVESSNYMAPIRAAERSCFDDVTCEEFDLDYLPGESKAQSTTKTFEEILAEEGEGTGKGVRRHRSKGRESMRMACRVKSKYNLRSKHAERVDANLESCMKQSVDTQVTALMGEDWSEKRRRPLRNLQMYVPVR